MSYLSNRDFYYDFGEKILIYPFNPNNVKGASINLSASEFAWDLSTRKRLKIKAEGGKKVLIIPPLSTVAIATKETIYVADNICGTYHTKVGMAMKGFGSISTTLDPEYIGTSLICLCNQLSVENSIVIGDTFTTLMFSYTSRSAFTEYVYKPNTPGQKEHVSEMEKGNEFLEIQRTLEYHDNKSKLKEAMNYNQDYIKWRKDFLERDTALKQKGLKIEKKKKVILALLTMFIYVIDFVIIIALVVGVVKFINGNKNLAFMLSYQEYFGPIVAILITLLMTKMTPYVINHFKRSLNNEQ